MSGRECVTVTDMLVILDDSVWLPDIDDCIEISMPINDNDLGKCVYATEHKLVVEVGGFNWKFTRSGVPNTWGAVLKSGRTVRNGQLDTSQRI